MIRTNSLILILILSLLLSGCMSFSASSGTRIESEQLNKIKPGTTTKDEVFEWIGAPMAVLAGNELNPVPMPFMWKSRVRASIQSDTFFELFSSKHQFNEYHRIYYFYYAVSTKTDIALIETTNTKFDKLWLLVDEKTGIVEDYKFRKGI